MWFQPSVAKMDQADIDLKMMRRCIELSVIATEQGEFPFACVIAEGDKIVVEVTNRVKRNADITQHAELMAVSEAQKVLGRKDLRACTLYSNVEPCVMCAFPMRETRIGRVIFAIASPMMGGFSKWNVLKDRELAEIMPEAFGKAPEVISGLLYREAANVWLRWNPLIWGVIRYRGCFGHGADADALQPAQAAAAVATAVAAKA